MTKPTGEELLQLCDDVWNDPDSCRREREITRALRERLVGEQRVHPQCNCHLHEGRGRTEGWICLAHGLKF
jgi:hypothetical protein